MRPPVYETSFARRASEQDGIDRCLSAFAFKVHCGRLCRERYQALEITVMRAKKMDG